MISLLDPRMWGVAIIALLLAFAAGDYHGHSAKAVKTELKEVKGENTALTGKIKLDNTLNVGADKITNDAAKEKQNAQTTTDAGSLAIRTRTVRLYLPATACTSAPAESAGAGPATATAEILPEIGERIYQTGRDADQTVRDLNQCIAKYNDARGRINAAAAQQQ